VLFRSGSDEVEPVLEEKMKVRKMMELCKFIYRIFSQEYQLPFVKKQLFYRFYYFEDGNFHDGN